MKQLAGNKGCLSSHTALDMKKISRPASRVEAGGFVCPDTELTKPRLYLSTDNCIKLWETFFRRDSLAR